MNDVRNLPCLALGSALVLAACNTYAMQEDADADPIEPAGQVAYARLMTATGDMLGRAVFSERAGGIEIDVELENMTPGTYAVHVHERGECSAPGFTSAGGHWNPTNQPHPRHLGDLGNAVVAADGTASLDATVAQASLVSASPQMIDGNGAALIVHAGADDMVSQPSGNAGPRMACSVITLG